MRWLHLICAAVAVIAFVAAPAARASAAFADIDVLAATNGSGPSGGLIADATGALYGTTNTGGNFNACESGCGTVFKLSPPASGKGGWTQTLLYVFNGGADGGYPEGALLADAHGVLYGTTSGGGSACTFGGCGTVFALYPPAAGKTAWTERVLHAFTNGTDGRYPQAALIADAHGILYGTTQAGGSDTTCGGGGGCGTVFKLTPRGSTWTETVLHSFRGGADGQAPSGALLADGSGVLYGSTEFGGGTGCGGPGCGAIFKLSAPAAASGIWSNAILHAFNGFDGLNPTTNLIADSHGALYGAAGPTVFELVPPGAGVAGWRALVVHAFTGVNGDGQYPNGGLIADSRGSLYGTTSAGGSSACGCGTVFELTPQASGFISPVFGRITVWTETQLHVFTGNDGENPSAGLTVDRGALVGETIFGGNFNACADTGCGAIFKL